MSWRDDQAAARRRMLEKYDETEADWYEEVVGSLSADDEAAYLDDLSRVVSFEPGQRVLDVGAGTGTISTLLSHIGGLEVTALEPAPAMVRLLRDRPELENVRVVAGFCDATQDRHHFEADTFHTIISRQAANVLYDPLAAFANWLHWLAPGGAAVVIDGLYDRDSWSGKWEEETDALPLSAIRTMATLPYLLEAAGFEIEAVAPMHASNARPTTRTHRYVVVARTPAA